MDRISSLGLSQLFFYARLQLEKPTSKKDTDESGRTGDRFQIPLSMGPKKEGSDKEAKPCGVWDFVVHPEAVTMALSNGAVKNMLAETAMETVEKSAKIKLSRCAPCTSPNACVVGASASLIPDRIDAARQHMS